MLKGFSQKELEQEDDKTCRWVPGPSVPAATVPTWPRRAEGDGSEGTPALWVRGLGRRTIMSDIGW